MKMSPLTTLAAAGMISICCSDGGQVDIGGTGNLVSDYAAHWDGYAEAFTFKDGSDRVRLTIDANGHGTLEVGDSPPLPPPTDPDVGYPANGLSYTQNFLAELRPGFRYPIYDAHVETRRIRLGVDFHDLWGAWCAMQTPYCQNCDRPLEEPYYLCVPNPGPLNDPYAADQTCNVVDPTSGQIVPVDCGKLLVCDSAPPCSCTNGTVLCPCDATSCGIPPVANGVYPVKIDAALEEQGTRLVGSLVTNDSYSHFPVRLTRQ